MFLNAIYVPDTFLSTIFSLAYLNILSLNAIGTEYFGKSIGGSATAEDAERVRESDRPHVNVDSGRVRPFVTVREFSTLAICYAG